MNCQTFQEQITGLIVPGTDPQTRAALAAHAESCPACAQYLAEMDGALNAVRPSQRITASNRFKEGVMNKIMANERKQTETPRRWLAWRPALAAAVVLIAIGLAWLSIGTRGGSTAAASALNKAVEAARGVRFIQIKSEPVAKGSVDRIWAQFENGKLVKMRMDFPDTEDGPKVVLVEGDQARVWFKAKNSVAVVREPDILKRMRMSVNDFDPHLLLEGLQKRAAAGEVRIETNGSMTKVEPIVLTVIYPKKPDFREQYTIDIPTGLVQQIEKFNLRDGKFVSFGKLIFLDYNNPKMAEVFELKPPDGIRVIDQVKNPVGLVRGSLSETEVAKAVARGFFEALIAGDYDTAGQLYEGI